MRTFARLLGLLTVMSFSSGCVVGLRSEPSAFPSEPPPAREETPGPKPPQCGPSCRFLPGYWHWDGGGYVWVAGHWEQTGGPVADSGR
ncbi:MAG: YXWGXW repeat-containing protein [Polyangiaceae bacterium]